MPKRKPTHHKKPWVPMRHTRSMPNGDRLYGNDRYTATVSDVPNTKDPSAPPAMCIGIHSHTRSAVGAHDWRHLQRIKNDIAGPEREAIELYPAESRLMDTANEFWLWVAPEGWEVPWGFFSPRHVTDTAGLRGDEPGITEQAAERGMTPDELVAATNRRSKQRLLDGE